MKAKLVNEALSLDKVQFHVENLNRFDKVWVGNKGLLGNNSIFIPWDYIDDLMKKYRK